MERLEKINNDFATLFREGQRLLQEGCGDVMNRHREEAFQRFEALGGSPIKRRTIFTRIPYRYLIGIIGWC